MKTATREIWAKQDQHTGDRWRLFQAVGAALGDVGAVLYPGCYADIAPSCVFSSVTYVDTDRRMPAFFGDRDGIVEIIAGHRGAPTGPQLRFIHGDYTVDLGLADESFDLLVSLYAGFISESCTRYLRVGGTLLVNPSHGDAAMASIDPLYRLSAVIESRSGDYRVVTTGLDEYLQPKRPVEVTAAMLHRTGRGVAYTRSPFAYLFERVR